MTTIYVVMGETGSYENQAEWPACAYYTKSMAETHAQRAESWAKAFQDRMRNVSDPEMWKLMELPDNKNPYDLDMGFDKHTGTIYTVVELDLRFLLPVLPPAPVNHGDY